MNLVHDLAGKYGKQKGFEDETFFDEIGKLTYPQIKEFLETYVAGSSPLPLQEVFDLVGVQYQAEVETKDSSFSIGNITMGYNPQTGRFKVADNAAMNSVGKTLGYMKGDELVEINGKKADPPKMNSILEEIYALAKPGDDLTVKVIRKTAEGKEETKDLKAVMTKFPVKKYNVLNFEDSPTEQQLALRNVWLSK